MRPSKRIVIGMSSAALVLGAGTGIATAAHQSVNKNRSNADRGPGRGGPPGAAAIATYLGLTSDELRAQLVGGKTLAAIATTQGKTVSGLEATIVADATTHLDAAVAAGTLTAAQEATMLTNLKAHVDELVNTTALSAGRRGGPGGPGGGPASEAIATYLGLTSDQVRTQLKSGKTLAQIATAQGKTVSGLEDAIVADAKTHLDAAVAAGKLSAAQEATMLARIKAHVDDRVNQSGPPSGGNGGAGRGGSAFGRRMAGANLSAGVIR
jgi:hypothetical protein